MVNTIRLKGGLGNQMFQYAFGLALAEKTNTQSAFDTRYLNDRSWRPGFVFRKYDLDIFGITNQTNVKRAYLPGEIYLVLLAEECLRRQKMANPWIKSMYVFENGFGFQHELMDLVSNRYYVGYFQSYKYFERIKSKIKNAFTLSHSKSENIVALRQKILNKNSVCLNVRRTDFIDSKFGIPQIEYYKSAVKTILCKTNDASFFIFSDDVDWCRSNFNWCPDACIVGHEYAGPKFRDYFDLMVSCKHFIIPNSTFAWWAAYLAEAEASIKIAPRGWHKYLGDCGDRDILPESWIRIGFNGD
jgi:hypothetical protein